MTDILQTPSSASPPPVAPQVLPSDPPVLKPINAHNTPSYHRSRNLLIALVIFALVLGLAFVGVSRIKPKPQDVTPPANELLATVGDQKIYVSTVEDAAKEQYTPSAITNVVLKHFEAIVIERTILDQEAKTKGITISDQDIQNDLKKFASASSTFSDSQKKATYYKLLKNNIILASTETRSIYNLGFWIPPLSYPQQPAFAGERADGQKALQDIQTQFKAGQDPFTVAQVIYTNYPTLREILALNGYFVKNLKTNTLVASPKVYTMDPKSMDKSLYTALTPVQAGDIISVQGNDGSGGSVVKVISVTHAEITNYDQWLQMKEKQQVKVIHSL